MPGDHWLESFVPYLLYRATNGLNRLLQARLRKAGINLTRWRVLSVLKAFGALNIGEIAMATAMEQPTLSRVVDQLEAEKLVTRRTATADSRFVYVDLTAAGEKLVSTMLPAMRSHQERALHGLTATDIKTLRRLLNRILQNIEAAD